MVAIGERERDPGERAAIATTAITVLDLDALRGGRRAAPGGAVLAARRRRRDRQRTPARGRLARPDGLSFDELASVLRELVAGAVGVQVTVFDPDLDADGSQARALTDCLVRGLAGAR